MNRTLNKPAKSLELTVGAIQKANGFNVVQGLNGRVVDVPDNLDIAVGDVLLVRVEINQIVYSSYRNVDNVMIAAGEGD